MTRGSGTRGGNGARVAFVIGDEFEDSEFRVPHDRLKQEGHHVVLVGIREGATVSGKRGKERVTVELAAKDADADDFDALVIPGGHAPDHLRTDADVVRFTRGFFEAGKPVAAVCHGPQLLIEAGVVRGRTLTSWPSVRTDLLNAGATWEDHQVVRDGNLITSRKPDDLEAFSKALLEALSVGAPKR